MSGVAAVGALAEADGAHLGQRADGLGEVLPNGEDAGDEGGADGAQADQQDAEACPVAGAIVAGAFTGAHYIIGVLAGALPRVGSCRVTGSRCPSRHGTLRPLRQQPAGQAAARRQQPLRADHVDGGTRLGDRVAGDWRRRRPAGRGGRGRLGPDRPRRCGRSRSGDRRRRSTPRPRRKACSSRCRRRRSTGCPTMAASFDVVVVPADDDGLAAALADLSACCAPAGAASSSRKPRPAIDAVFTIEGRRLPRLARDCRTCRLRLLRSRQVRRIGQSRPALVASCLSEVCKEEVARWKCRFPKESSLPPSTLRRPPSGLLGFSNVLGAAINARRSGGARRRWRSSRR